MVYELSEARSPESVGLGSEAVGALDETQVVSSVATN